MQNNENVNEIYTYKFLRGTVIEEGAYVDILLVED